MMTIQAVFQARNWQWLLDECQNVKRELGRGGSEIGSGRPLSREYERALGSLRAMLERSRNYYQSSLNRFLIKSPAFSNVFKVTDTTHGQLLGPVMKISLRDYSTLYRDDRIGWCLFQLTRIFDHQSVFEPSAVLRCLDDFLNDCSRKEAERIDPDMHICISRISGTVG